MLIRKLQNEHTTISYGTDDFSFFWLKFAGFGMMLYYIVEMVNRVLFVTLEDTNPLMWEIWRIADSVYFTIMLIPIGIQAISWKNNNIGVENKKKANYAFFSIIGAGIFVLMYEVLTSLRAELDYSHRGDLSVPFLLMIILHFIGIIFIKNLITALGRYKEVRTGDNIFYILFALNPVIRYLLPFIILIFSSLSGTETTIFYFFGYSELAMTYLSSVVAVGFFIFIWKDSKKIKFAQLFQKQKQEQEPKNNGLPEIKGIKYIETQNKIIKIPLKQDFSVFCPKCGVVIYDGAKICSNCGKSLN